MVLKVDYYFIGTNIHSLINVFLLTESLIFLLHYLCTFTVYSLKFKLPIEVLHIYNIWSQFLELDGKIITFFWEPKKNAKPTQNWSRQSLYAERLTEDEIWALIDYVRCEVMIICRLN